MNNTNNNTQNNTGITNKTIVFAKDSAGWYAVMQGSRSQNSMVAGADVLIEALSNGGNRVEMTLSADVEDPAPYVMRLHRVEHDPFGATYRVSGGTAGEAPRFRGIMGLPLAWLCNQTHVFLGADHPLDIYVHSVRAA